MGPWVGVRFLTTRVSPNDTNETKMVMRWDDSRGKKMKKKEEKKDDIGMKNR